ncbi:hypothetical protein D3M79_04055 [Rodentibacter pneumotropicus]|uniref:hypothetical protein n=2 Tax=Rodentibacter pneumotropicus TaxID=758 RepID=UPI00109D2302|nr:hypothetical protein [Rodentibacter pneumotropicus]THA00468.1 hypothetical protein D3M79_04055 [Rodentibacter pneumotropicus]THA00719.1 hypothetical protein D3M74_07045 [Rodentibacter pneumotropicus]THA06976.1 hypothetical protein D3M77_06930 [Rodentibacter pneumotropicus]
MPSIKLTQFGGIAPRQRPNNLHQAMAQVAEDVDLSRGTLRPWRTDKKVSDKTGNSIFVDKCCYLAGDHCKASFSRIDTDCCYIVASGVKDYPVIQRKDNACNDNWNRLGFPVELNAPNAQFLGTLSQDFNQELRQYIYTLVDEFGFESAPSLPSDPIYVHNDQSVVISGLPTSYPTYSIAKVRLYCAVTQLDYGEQVKDQNAEAHFLLVDEVSFGTGSYVHQAHRVYGEECLTEEYEPPHECMTDLQYCGNGQIGGLVGTELWLSEPLKPHAFPEAYRYGHFKGKPIRFLCGERAGYILTDSYPVVIEMESPCQSQGCRSITQLEEPLPIISYQSACLYNGACFYATKDGLVMLAGNQAKVMTTALYTKDQWQALAPWQMIGVVHDGYYFGFTDRTSIRFKVPDSIHEDVQIEQLTMLSIKPKAVYRSDQDELFFAADDGIYQWNAGDNWKAFRWRGRLHNLPQYMAMTAYKVVQDYEPNQVKHIGYKRHRSEMVQEPVILSDKTVIDSRPHRLKAGYATLFFDVEITGKGEVWEYHIATSVAELGSE